MYPLNKIKDGTAVFAEAPLSFKEGIAKFNPRLFSKYEREKRLSHLDQRKTSDNISPLSNMISSDPHSPFKSFGGKPDLEKNVIYQSQMINAPQTSTNEDYRALIDLTRSQIKTPNDTISNLM